jgi:hypothetical protein
MTKYHAIQTTVDGIVFASKAEARRYGELKLLERAGEVTGLQLQPRFDLACGGRPLLIRSAGFPKGRASYYLADFEYYERDGTRVIEDVKGMDTPVSRLKRAVVEAEYGLRITLVR